MPGFRFSVLNTEHPPSNATRVPPGSHNIRFVPTDRRRGQPCPRLRRTQGKTRRDTGAERTSG